MHTHSLLLPNGLQLISAGLISLSGPRTNATSPPHKTPTIRSMAPFSKLLKAFYCAYLGTLSALWMKMDNEGYGVAGERILFFKILFIYF